MFTDIGSWGNAPVGHVEDFVRLYARGYVGVGLPTRPALEVALVSLISDGMVPSSTPHFNWASFIGRAHWLRF